MANQELLTSAQENFISNMTSLGFSEIGAVPITSGLDPTTRLIGSHVSVFKSWIIPGFEPGNPEYAEDVSLGKGLTMLQPCMRTQNLRHVGKDHIVPEWASYFPSMGSLVPADQLVTLVGAAHDYIEAESERTSIAEPVRLRVSSAPEDQDLRDAIEEVGLVGATVVDDMPSERYRHVIGHPEIVGRNFNFAVLNPRHGEYRDFGNVIILESAPDADHDVSTVELALGASTMIANMEGLPHPIDSFGIDDAPICDHPLRTKYLDYVLSGTVLLGEGIKPGGSGNIRRITRDYLRAAWQTASKIGMTREAQARIAKSAVNTVSPSDKAEGIIDRIIVDS